MTPLGRSFAILVSAVLGAACSLHVDDFKPGAAAGDSAVSADTSVVDDSSTPPEDTDIDGTVADSESETEGDVGDVGDTGCPAGKTLCPSGCIDLKVPDNTNCGMCGTVCPAGKTCKAPGAGTGGIPTCK